LARLHPLVSSPLADAGKPISAFSQSTTCASTCTAELSRPERVLFIAAATSPAPPSRRAPPCLRPPRHRRPRRLLTNAPQPVDEHVDHPVPDRADAFPVRRVQ